MTPKDDAQTPYQDDDHRSSRRLQRSILAYMIASVLLISIAVSLVGVVPMAHTLYNERLNQIRVTADMGTRTVNRVLQGARNVAMQIASRSFIRERLSDYNEGVIPLETVQRLAGEKLEDAMISTDGMLGIILLDRAGLPVLFAGEDFPLASWMIPAPFEETAQVRGVTSLSGEQVVIIGTPITNDSGSRIGSDIIAYSMDDLAGFIANHDGLGRTGELILARMTETGEELFFPVRNASSANPTATVAETMRRVDSGEAVFELGRFVSAASRIAGTDWFLIVRIEKWELAAPVTARLVSLVFFIIIVSLIGVYGMARLISPLTGKMILRADELTRQVENKTRELAAARDELSGQVGTILDINRKLEIEISERQRAETNLRRSQEVLRGVFHAIPDLIAVYDHGRTVVMSNWDANVPAAGLTLRDAAVHEDGCNGNRPESCPACMAGKVFETGEAAFIEIIEGDREYQINMYPVFSGAGVVGLVVEHIRDITETRRTEEMIRVLSEAINQSAIGVLVADLDGTVRYMNRTLLSAAGHDRLNGLVGRDIEELGQTSDVLARCAAAVADPEVKPREPVAVGDGESRRWEMVSASPIRDDAGNIRSILCLREDVTDRFRLEEQLRQAQKMEAVGQLAGGIAHDFNNILTSIIGCASILRLKLGEGGALFEYVEQILSSSDRASKLTQGLLAFSRKQISAPKPMALNAAAKKTVEMLTPILGGTISVETALADESLTVLADPVQMEQVLVNLLTNARDAMPGGGTIFVGARRTRIDDTFVRIQGYGRAGNYAQITVSDSGSGMAESVRKRVFEPFFTTKEVGKGTGLGLSIVYGIVKQHGGYIICTSEAGRGTTFTVYLPLLPDSMLQDDDTGETLAKGGTERILVAEDDPAVRRIARSVLSEYGYSVLTAADGKEAVEIFSHNRDTVSLVVLDLVMPRMDGAEAYRRITAMKPEVKALFMSGYADAGIDVDAGVPRLPKPVTADALLAKVRQLLDAGVEKL